LKLKFGTTGINIGGYEGTTLVLENVTSTKLFVNVKMVVEDFCGGSKIRNIGVTINPNDKVGGNTWMGGSEQLDYSSPCKERKKYPDNFSTKISSVSLEIVSVKELSKPTGDKNANESKPDGNETKEKSDPNPTEKNESTSSSNHNSTCPTYGFKFSNTPSFNCVALEWWSLSTKVNIMDASGNLKQSSIPEANAFTIQFREQGKVNWIAEERINSGRNLHLLKGLNACTKYEVRLISICENDNSSKPSNIVRFTTACDKPGNIQIENISNNSAKINNELQTISSYPCKQTQSPIRIIEYKTSNTNWEEVFCNSGSPCLLSTLRSGTTYRLRARYKYGDNLYSTYTNEVSFKTNGITYPNESENTTNSSGNIGSIGILKTPSMLSPALGEKVQGYLVELSWADVIGANSYEILIATNSDFSDAIYFTTSKTKYLPSNYGIAPFYYWKVKAKGANGKHSFWSLTATFKVQD
jgi:hypothetical protein